MVSLGADQRSQLSLRDAALGATMAARNVPMLVRLPDGALRGARLVRPLHVLADGAEAPAGGGAAHVRYAISLEVDDGG